jgi:phage-related protein
MANMDDLLSSLTDEDGIRPDFVEAVRKAYDDDLSVSITQIGELESQLSDANAASEAATAQHGAEITALKASFFDQIQSANVSTEVDSQVVDPEIEDDEPTAFYTED